MGILLTTTGLYFLTASGLVPISDTPAPGGGGEEPQPEPGAALILPGKVDWVHDAYVGEPLVLDFSAQFAEDIDTLTPAAVPFTVSGRVLTITPEATSATTTYTVSTGAESVSFEMKVGGAPAPLQALGTVRSPTIEVGRPDYISWWRYHTGGVPPYRYEQISGPDWVETRRMHTLIHPQDSARSGTVTVRVTDRRGRTLDLTSTVTVIAERSRAATYTLQAGQTVAEAVTAGGLGGGGVLLLPAGLDPIEAGDLSAIDIDVEGGQAPLIITAEPGAEVLGPFSLQGARGIIFEKATIRDPGGTVNAAQWLLRAGDDIYLYDLIFPGATTAVTPNTTTWEFQDRFFTYPNHGIFAGNSRHCVVHGCSIDQQFKACDPTGALVYGNTIGRVRDDIFRAAEGDECLVINNIAITETLANRKQSEHPDFFQAHNIHAPEVHFIWVQGNLYDSHGQEVQGSNIDNKQWDTSTRDWKKLFQSFIWRDNAIFVGVWQGSWLEWIGDGDFDNNAILLHPDKIRSDVTFCRIYHGRPSRLSSVRGNVVGQFGGDAHGGAYGDFRHLWTMANNVEMDRAGAPTYEFAMPNWSNTALPMLERARLSPAFVAAYPGVGPSMLMPEAQPEDTIPPVLTSTSPADGATAVSTKASPVLIFNEPVVATAGSFTLRNDTLGSNIQTIAATSPAVTISGNQVTINLADMAAATDWTLSAPAGVITDAAGNPAAAISLSFTTAAAGAPFDDEVLQSGTSISYRGTTWPFYSDTARTTPATVHWYVSAMGDPVVITDPAYMPSTVYLGPVSPNAATDGSGYKYNGLVRNPKQFSPEGQGFDGILGIIVPQSKVEQNLAYNDALNVDPRNTGGSLAINPGDEMTLVKMVAVAGRTSSTYQPVGAYVPLAFINQLPPSAGDWFAPGVAAPNKQWLGRFEDIDLGRLRDIPQPTGIMLPSEAVADIESKKYQLPPLWFHQSERHRRSQVAASDNYSREVGRERGKFLIAMHIDPATTADPAGEAAARLKLVKYIVQWAIHTDSAVLAGSGFSTGAGQHFGYQAHQHAGAFLLGNADMLARAKTTRGNTLDQPIYVTEQLIGFPTMYNPGSAGGGSLLTGETLRAGHLGDPIWCISRRQTEASGALVTAYLDTFATTSIYEALAIGLFQNVFGTDGANAAVQGTSRGAAFDYIDRSAPCTLERTYSTQFSHDDTSRNLWFDLRDYIGRAKWTGRPDIPQSYHGQFTPGGAAGTVDFDVMIFSPYNHSTLPITDREIQYSNDFDYDGDGQIHVYQYVDSGLASIGLTATVAGLRPGENHMRWRQQNAEGWSDWSRSWGLRLPGHVRVDETVPRGKVIVPGTASGAVTKRADPVVLYKPYSAHEMPLYEPAPASGHNILTFYAGGGYFTGGAGATLARTFQWQRNSGSGGAWQNISGATARAYNRVAADSGYSIRVNVTVGSITVASNAIAIPAVQVRPAGTIIDTRFDGEFLFDYPALWAEMREGQGAATRNNSILVELLHDVKLHDDVSRGAVRVRRWGSWGRLDVDITTTADPGTYDWEMEFGGGYFPVNSADSMTVDITAELRDSTGAVRGDASAVILKSVVDSDGAYSQVFSGQFTVSSGDRHIRLYVSLPVGSGSTWSGSQSGVLGGGVLSGLTIRKVA